MSDSPSNEREAETSAAIPTEAVSAAPERELVLDLNFVPEWARKPPGATSYFEQGGRGDRPAFRSGGDRGPRRDSRGPDNRRGSGGGGGRPPAGPGNRRPAGDRLSDFDRSPRFQRPVFQAPLPLSIRFLPDDRHLAAVIKRIRATRRAYTLGEVVGLFLSNPDACRVKIELDAPDVRLFQCKRCGVIAMDRGGLEAHLMRDHFEDDFVVEQKQGEPPAGNFVCVAKCGLSGVLLAPPNHNTYAERVEEVHRASFAHMPLDEYRRNIQTIHDPALIEQWRTEASTQTLYRPKSAPADEPGIKRSAAAELFLKQHAAEMVKTATSASLPAAVARQISDERLSQALAAAWNRECRAPRSLPIAIQGALRGRHLHLFRAGQGTRFVTGIPPAPLDPQRAVSSIRDVLNHLREKPGIKRPQLLEDLRPGATADSPQAAEILSPLGWLIERGHIIEFFDGTLAVPLA